MTRLGTCVSRSRLASSRSTACETGTAPAFDQSGGHLRSVELKTATGSVPGIVAPTSSHDTCTYFVGQAAARALDDEATLVVAPEGEGVAEQIPLTARDTQFVPDTPFDAAARLAYEQPLSHGYPGLLQMRNAIYYRLSPVRIGGVFEARLGPRTALLGTGVLANVDLALSDRWFFELEGSYSLGIAPYGRGNWDGQWYHGPGAILSLGHAPAQFLGAPPTADRSAFGPTVAMEYLLVPRRDQGVFILSAGLFVGTDSEHRRLPGVRHVAVRTHT